MGRMKTRLTERPLSALHPPAPAAAPPPRHSTNNRRVTGSSTRTERWSRGPEAWRIRRRLRNSPGVGDAKPRRLAKPNHDQPRQAVPVATYLTPT